MKKSTCPTDRLSALAFAAYRINHNQIIKTTHVDAENNALIQANQILMLSDIEPTTDDIKQAQQAQELLKKYHMFNMLKNQKIDNFQQNIIDLITQPQCSLKYVSLLVWLPQVVEQITRRQLRDEQVNKLNFSESYLGQPGEKITFDFQMISQRYIDQLGCWTVEGHDGHGHLISFLTQRRDCLDSGCYTGRVKKTEHSKYHNMVATTMLNYVKPVKKT